MDLRVRSESESECEAEVHGREERREKRNKEEEEESGVGEGKDDGDADFDPKWKKIVKDKWEWLVIVVAKPIWTQRMEVEVQVPFSRSSFCSFLKDAFLGNQRFFSSLSVCFFYLYLINYNYQC